MAVKIQFRRDTAVNWQNTNPILSQGELGLDITNNRFKLGDGATAWNDLDYTVDFQPDGTYPDLRAQATTALDVGLGNVTNESKATMFTDPTFTGTVSGVTKTHVNLGNVDNTSDLSKPISTATQQALNTKADASALSSHTGDTTIHFLKTDVSKGDVGLGNVLNVAQIPASEKGEADGVATLDGSGLVPSDQLPSYVDDVLEGFFNETDNLLYTDDQFTPGNEISGELGKIYVDTSTGNIYRYTGTIYVEISNPLDFASQAEAEAGTNDTKAMSPARTAEAIAALTPEVDVSTEYSAGVIETNNDSNLKFWRGTQAEFDALTVNNELFNGILTNQVEQVIDVPLATFTASGKFTINANSQTYVAFENGEFQTGFDSGSFIDTDGTIYIDSDVLDNITYFPAGNQYGIKFEENATDPNKTTILWQGGGEPNIQQYDVIAEADIFTGDSNTEYIITDEAPTVTSVNGDTGDVTIEGGLDSFNVTIPTLGWQIESSGDWFGKYTTTISLNGIEDTNRLLVDLDLTNATSTNVNALINDFNLIFAFEALTNEIKIYANGLPREPLALNISVV